MGFLRNLFKKPQPLLTEEDTITLRDIQRKAYMEEAKKIMEEKGRQMAKDELGIKRSPYQ